MVYLNKNQNKRVVALNKIVHCHDLVNIDYTSLTLPLVMSKVGESNTDKSLSQMYCLLCKNQHEIEKICSSMAAVFRLKRDDLKGIRLKNR